ncbi:unnamed protein product [Rotaria magnacalcarata]|uniref:Uncharacterized protein n=2 Tax=Rotaria magnacalcarata TaxID=392030 RepID=A0A816SG52_9BILA|nr:unnamed protein product [Rotaria magnacalcarata]
MAFIVPSELNKNGKQVPSFSRRLMNLSLNGSVKDSSSSPSTTTTTTSKTTTAAAAMATMMKPDKQSLIEETNHESENKNKNVKHGDIYIVCRVPQRRRLNLFGSPSKFDRDQVKSDDRHYRRSDDDFNDDINDNNYYYDDDDRYGVYDDEDDYDEDEDAAETDRLIHELFLECEKDRWAKLGRKVPDNFVNPFEIDD